jgi:hypothetical protein
VNGSAWYIASVTVPAIANVSQCKSFIKLLILSYVDDVLSIGHRPLPFRSTDLLQNDVLQGNRDVRSMLPVVRP